MRLNWMYFSGITVRGLDGCELTLWHSVVTKCSNLRFLVA